jgi:hypothetical protein
MTTRTATLFLFAALAAFTFAAEPAEGSKRLVIGDVPPHTVGAYRPFAIPGEIEVSDGLVELRKGREITVWCPDRVAKEKPKVAAAAKRFVESPFLPVKSISVGYVGNKEGEAILKELGIAYKAYGPAEPWKLAGHQVAVLGPGTEAIFRPGPQTDSLRKQVSGMNVIVLPGADLSLLPYGLSRKAGEVAGGEVSLPNLPLFCGTTRDFADFAAQTKGTSVDVMDAGPAWMLKSSPACFAHVRNKSASIILFNVAPSSAPASARPALTRMWCTMLANMNIETGTDAK